MNANPQSCLIGLTPYTLIVNTTGNLVASTFPTVTKLATFTFNMNLGILGLQLSTTLTNFDTGLVGLFVVAGTAALANTLTLVNGVNNGLWLSHVTNQNAVTGFASPASRSTTLGFAESGVHLQAGEAVSIFGCSPNNVADVLVGLLSLYCVPST